MHKCITISMKDKKLNDNAKLNSSQFEQQNDLDVERV